MRIAFFAETPLSEYSGGRYHSWLMAEALAHRGNSVYYITNNIPAYHDDFKLYRNHGNIRLCITPNFLFRLPRNDFDFVVIVPSKTRSLHFYLRALHFSEKRNAKIILLNFETPNWFNAFSPEKVDATIWDNWELVGLKASLILSSAREGNRFAKRFYSYGSSTEFNYCYPSINSIVADSVGTVQKEKRILLITRFGRDRHKGGYDVGEILSEAMRGYTIVVLVGSGGVPGEIMTDLLEKCGQHGVGLEIKYKLSDYEKFVEIKRARLMVFPSFFEGFGLPPVEAQYCNTPCIVFDLPVLREISGDGLCYVEAGNWKELRSRIAEMIRSKETNANLVGDIWEVACFEEYAARLDVVMQEAKNSSAVIHLPLWRALQLGLRSYVNSIMASAFTCLMGVGRLSYVLLAPANVLLWLSGGTLKSRGRKKGQSKCDVADSSC